MGIQAIPNQLLGAGTPPRRSPERPTIRARFPAGRWWRVRITQAQPWAVLQVQLAAIMHRDIHTFSIWCNGQRVRQEAAIPQGTAEVELHRVGRAGVPDDRAGEEPPEADPAPWQPDQRGASQSPPRRPPPEMVPSRSRSRSPGPHGHHRGVRNGPPVFEANAVMVEYPTSEGIFRLNLQIYSTGSLEWPLQ